MSELSTAIGNIYNRLADSTSTPTFHPASADLFTDWNVQAGDVVTVKSDSESYQVPVYSMKMRWSGAPRVLVESTGNPEREPLPAIKRREYSANSTNYKEQKALKSGVAGISNTMQNAGLYVNDQGVWAFANDPTNGLGATFSIQRSQIDSKVSATDYNGNEIASRINQTATTILIQAQKIQLEGLVQAGFVTSDILQAAFQDAQSVITNTLDVESTFWYRDRSAKWASATVVTGVNYTTVTIRDHDNDRVSFKALSGNSPITTETIYYLAEDGMV